MSKPHFGKWGLRDYLYYQFNLGETTESSHNTPVQVARQKSPRLDTYEIGLIATRQFDANRVLALFARTMRKHLPNSSRHRFTAYGLDQAWRPQQLFDEVHWFDDNASSPLPHKILVSLGRLVHIHLPEISNAQLQSEFRTYHWSSEGAMVEFWASLYLSRELCCLFELDWESYFLWQPRISCVAKVNTGWGVSPSAAVDALLASADATNQNHSDGEILVIEGGISSSIGDYVNILNALEGNFEFNFVTTSWVSPNYLGYGLKLLRFRPT